MEFPFAATCSEKEQTEKFPFIATNNWVALAVRWSVKYFFAPNFPLIQKSGGDAEDGENRQIQNVSLFTQTQIKIISSNDLKS